MRRIDEGPAAGGAASLDIDQRPDLAGARLPAINHPRGDNSRGVIDVHRLKRLDVLDRLDSGDGESGDGQHRGDE